MTAVKSELFLYLREAKRPLVVILGPTASGKTVASLDLAESIRKNTGRSVEIVNADSRQMYRFLDIGTAKIQPDEMRGIPHHLLDVLDPKQEITAGEYQAMACRAIDEILQREAVPVLVGGSMLYLSAVIDNLSFAGTSDTALRAKLKTEYDTDEGTTLYARLSGIDPDTAAAFHPRNKTYLIRALEILESTGRKPSEIKESSASKYNLFIIGITRSRAGLVERINERTKKMFADGWIGEVRSLIDRGYGPHDPGMKSHGYREIMAYLRDRIPKNASELIEVIAANTRQYAKRQVTWWRRDERIRWVSL